MKYYTGPRTSTDCREETKEMKLEDSILGVRSIKSLHLHICVATDVVRERGRRAGCLMYHGSIPQRAKNSSLRQKVQTGYPDLCPWAKWPGARAYNSPLSSAAFRSEWSHSSTILHSFVAWTGTVWDINTQSLFSDSSCLYLETFGLAPRWKRGEKMGWGWWGSAPHTFQCHIHGVARSDQRYFCIHKQTKFTISKQLCRHIAVSLARAGWVPAAPFSLWHITKVVPTLKFSGTVQWRFCQVTAFRSYDLSH